MRCVSAARSIPSGCGRCRHVSARLERALVACGERVIRVAPGLMGESRKAVREPGKSDPIDATVIALAAIREGVESFPAAFLDEQAIEIRDADRDHRLRHQRDHVHDARRPGIPPPRSRRLIGRKHCRPVAPVAWLIPCALTGG